MLMSHRATRALTIALPLLLLSAPSAFSAKIGVASAVRNQVEGVSGQTRMLSAGSEVFANERIRTGDAATAQLLFLDKTVLSVGPKAELVLDKFVYNPNRGSGQVVVDAVKGSFRFVTGSQNPNNYAIKTPVATLGIRGTVIDLLVQTNQTIVVLVEGAVSIRMTDGRIYNLTKPGTAFIINANGQVTGPAPWDGTIVNAANGVNFPLFGWTFSGDPQDNRVPFDHLQSIDQLNAISGRAFVPPPMESFQPPPNQCTGNCNF